MSEPEREPEHKYGADEITVLEGLEAVRKRPGMYIGATSQRGLHHLVYEVLDNSVDEALAGYCDQITTTLLPDGSISVRDNGRGIPVERNDKYDMSTVQVVLTMLHAGGKFGGGGYKVSGGLHGVGVSVVNALSEWLIVEVRSEGFVWTQSFARGEPTSELTKGEPTSERGTTVTFKPDADIFETTEVDFEVLETREREMAFLTRGLRLTLIDQRTEDRVEEFYAENGLADYVRHINKNRTPTHKTQIAFERETEEGIVEVAMQWNDSYQASVHSFANNINTHEGGTHLTGFRSALTRTVNAYARSTGLIKEKDEPLGQDDAHEGLVAIISVKLQDPQFEGQTKTKLGNSPMRSLVETTTNAALGEWFEEHPAEARAIINKALQAARARQAARKARDLVRRKTALENSRLPGKLKDCSNNDPAQCELFLVEGNSAGGTAGDARDREFQAILPLRGKILNVEKARINKILSNVEIQAMITTINTGIGEEFNLDGLRYHKIVAMTDADVDGAHIRTLILTFFFRHMLPMIEAGHVYIAQPPLYRLKFGRREALYLQNDSELERILLRERLGDIEVADRYGESPRFTEVRYQRFLGALREYEGWAARLRSEFGGPAVELHQGPPPDRGAGGDAGRARELLPHRRSRRRARLRRGRRAARRCGRPLAAAQGDREAHGCRRDRAAAAEPVRIARLRRPAQGALAPARARRASALHRHARQEGARVAHVRGAAHRDPRCRQGGPGAAALQGPRRDERRSAARDHDGSRHAHAAPRHDRGRPGC